MTEVPADSLEGGLMDALMDTRNWQIPPAGISRTLRSKKPQVTSGKAHPTAGFCERIGRLS